MLVGFLHQMQSTVLVAGHQGEQVATEGSGKCGVPPHLRSEVRTGPTAPMLLRAGHLPFIWDPHCPGEASRRCQLRSLASSIRAVVLSSPGGMPLFQRGADCGHPPAERGGAVLRALLPSRAPKPPAPRLHPMH